MGSNNSLVPHHPLAPYRRASPDGRRRAILFLLLLCGLASGVWFALFAPALVMPLLAPVVLLLLLVIWALPDMDRAPTRLLAGFQIAFLIALPLWPNYVALALPGMPWITLLRLIGGPMVLLLLLCLSVSGGFRHDLSQSLRDSGPVWKLMAALVVVQFLSLLPAALHGGLADAVEAFILAQVNWTAIFFISAYVFLRPGRAAFLAGGLLVAAALLIGAGAMEWRAGAVPWAGHIPSFLKIQDPLVQNVLAGSARAATGIHRVQATYTTSLGLAEYLALVTPFALHMAVGGRRHWIRAAAALLLPAIFWTILLTDSRLGVVGFCLTFLLYLFIHGVLKWRSERRGLLGPAIVLAYPLLFSGFVLATFLIGRLNRLVWGGGAASYSTQARIEQYRKGLRLFLDNPLGYGIGRGGVTLHYTNQAGQGTIDTYYLLILLEYGLVGFVIFYGLFLAGVWTAGRRLFALGDAGGETALLIPLLIAMGNWLVIKSIFAQPDNNPLIFAMLGMMVALVHRSRQPTQSGLPRRPSSPSRQPASP